jgi:hypothetical protein
LGRATGLPFGKVRTRSTLNNCFPFNLLYLNFEAPKIRTRKPMRRNDCESTSEAMIGVALLAVLIGPLPGKIEDKF